MSVSKVIGYVMIVIGLVITIPCLIIIVSALTSKHAPSAVQWGAIFSFFIGIVGLIVLGIGAIAVKK